MRVLAEARGPEVLGFSVDESELAIRAISYHVSSCMDTLEANWGTEAVQAFRDHTASCLERVDSLRDFTRRGSDLAHKFTTSKEKPDEPVELNTDELSMLGTALYSLGNNAVKKSVEGLEGPMRVSFSNSEARDHFIGKVISTQEEAFRLFAQLKAVAQGRPDIGGWMVWTSPTSFTELQLGQS